MAAPIYSINISHFTILVVSITIIIIPEGQEIRSSLASSDNSEGKSKKDFLNGKLIIRIHFKSSWWYDHTLGSNLLT